ncbi:uncharacterized protein EKO05_0004987 [Ascochyta rabiei]|uniref:Uncharacterized protein n=1 Tax=Didymella rabiei TaxID=5454 RepID=A0A163KI21_DIDRA|nr:uncharacterized protein EKO05_0004987 [Ascochyta rabiei]KZM27015.1 hypothetical protein ST47_g1821 [Ascochyta rabiei]UPX14507.1 hypothetical protein EKO05_0004987 [Ascochyta rabiei]
MAAVVAGTASAQSAPSATALTFWKPGPALNPSLYSKQGFGSTTYPPVASIITSDAATTIFQLGCPSFVPATQSPILDGSMTLTCDWATNSATYTLINSTRNVMHETYASPAYSRWWTCDYNTAATQMTCALEVIGGEIDTNGPVSDWVIPDKAGNVIAFATAEIVTEGSFAALLSTGSVSGSAPTRLMTQSASGPAPTATQGSGVAGSEPSRTASASASASAATVSTAAAAKYGVEGAALAVLAGVAAMDVW